MTEKVSVCNLALGWVGAKPITSLEDDSNEARLCKVNYIPARDATLEAHEWSFAIKRFIPALINEPTLFGPVNQFSVPSDIIRVLTCDRQESAFVQPASLFGSGIQPEQADWHLESNENGRVIISSQPVLYCRGLRRIEDEGIYSPLFDHAFAAHLAWLIAIPLSQSATVQNAMAQVYERKIQEAKTRDGLQGRSRRIRHRTMHKSRFSFGNRH